MKILLIFIPLFLYSCERGQGDSVIKQGDSVIKNEDKILIKTDTLDKSPDTLYYTLLEISKNEYKSIEHDINTNILLVNPNISKSNGVLKIKCDNGKIKKYYDIKTNSDDDTERRIYEIKGFFEDIKYYYISVSCYETTEFLMVNQKTGSEFFIWGKPIISPDNSMIISFGDSFGYSEMANGIQLYKFLPNGDLVKLWEQEIENWKPRNLIWIDNKTLLLEQIIPAIVSSTKEEEIKYFKMSINNVSLPK